MKNKVFKRLGTRAQNFGRPRLERRPQSFRRPKPKPQSFRGTNSSRPGLKSFISKGPGPRLHQGYGPSGPFGAGPLGLLWGSGPGIIVPLVPPLHATDLKAYSDKRLLLGASFGSKLVTLQLILSIFNGTFCLMTFTLATIIKHGC